MGECLREVRRQRDRLKKRSYQWVINSLKAELCKLYLSCITFYEPPERAAQAQKVRERPYTIVHKSLKKAVARVLMLQDIHDPRDEEWEMQTWRLSVRCVQITKDSPAAVSVCVHRDPTLTSLWLQLDLLHWHHERTLLLQGLETHNLLMCDRLDVNP